MNTTWDKKPWRRIVVATAAVAAGSLAMTACAGASAKDAGSDASTVSIAGFSVLKTANTQVIEDFKTTDAGKGVTFRTSYGASGDQARAVIAGLKADEVHLSLEPDVSKLVDAKLVGDSWKDNAHKGIVTQSVVTLVVRKGNPKNIQGWDDLIKPGVKVVTPNPGSSGSAKWNILGAYGHVLADGGSEAEASAYLTKLLDHVAALPGSARDATTAFEGGTGDVLLSYENEVIEARQAGADFDYVVPDQTLLIQNPVALTENASDAAKAFLEFQLSEQGQKHYAQQGFRPLDESVKTAVKGANDESDPFPAPAKLLTIDDDFGGWSVANKKFFDEKDGIVTKLLAASGKS